MRNVGINIAAIVEPRRSSSLIPLVARKLEEQ